MTLTEIADDIAAHGDVSAEAALARMAAETVAVAQDIPTSEIKSYLILVDRWLPIKRSAADIAEITRDALATFESFRITDPAIGTAVSEKLTEILDALIAEGLAGAPDKAAVLALGSRTEPKWPGLDIGKVQDAMTARSEGRI